MNQENFESRHEPLWAEFERWLDALASRRASAAEQKSVPPEPRLQVTPSKELNAHDARVNGELDTYGWIDRPTGKVRVPIERAMDLVLERGLEVRK